MIYAPHSPSWFEIWLPINGQTVPAHILGVLWSATILTFLARPGLRQHLKGVIFFIMLGHVSAVLWSLCGGLLNLKWDRSFTYNSWDYGLKPDPLNQLDAVLAAGAQTIGVLGEFAILWIVSGLVLLMTSSKRSTEQAGAYNP
jgi:hypothetical protein